MSTTSESKRAEWSQRADESARELFKFSGLISGRPGADQPWADLSYNEIIRAAIQRLYDVDYPFAEFDTGSDVESAAGPGGWPKTQHLRLHWLADRDGGWHCQHCGVGLIDTCRNDDVTTGTDGKRVVKSDCTKRLPTLDHKIPRDLGGSNDSENIELVCRPCNSRKGAA